MATLQFPCSTKLKSLNKSLAYNRERKQSFVIASATVTRTHPSFQLLPVNTTTYKPMFQELPPISKKLQTLFDKDEVDVLVERLEVVVEKLVEIEINKFMVKVKADTLSDEDGLIVDDMRKEIAKQYLEKPLRYLKNGCCKVSFEQKIKDVRFLVNMLEESLMVES